MATNNVLNTGVTPLAATQGGSGVASPTIHGILVAQGASAYSPKVLNDGELLIGSTGADPVAATLTAGSGINIDNSVPGAITISSTTAGSNWVDQTTSPVTAVADSGYFIDNGATQVVITLPAAPAFGATVRVAGFSAGGWQILPGAGDAIQIGEAAAATSVTSANQYDAIELVYGGVTNAMWTMLSGVSAGFVIV